MELKKEENPRLGQDLLSNFKFYSGYSKYIDELGRYETWEESVNRVFDGMHGIKFKELLETNPKFKEYYDYAKKAYADKFVLASQRSLQFGGEPILKHNSKMFNCLTLYCDRPRFFQDTMYWLLSGCGVGFSVQNKHIDRLPKVKKRSNRSKVHIIEDSIEGWADAIGVFMSSYFEGEVPFPKYQNCHVGFDFSQIRPKGAKISGGFKAPGPDGLRTSLQKMEDLMEKELDKPNFNGKLESIVAYDLVMYLCESCLSGGVRRSASICLFSPDDEKMLKAKTGKWFIENPQRGRSNNTVLFNRNTVTKEQFHNVFQSVKEFGEPGFGFTEDEDIIYNPCQPAWAKVLTKEGIREFKDINIGDYIWSSEGWTKILNKWSTGVKKVYKYGTTFNSFYGTENHKVLDNGVKTEVKDAKAIDLLSGDKDIKIEFIPEIINLGFIFDINNDRISDEILFGTSDVVCSFLKGFILSNGQIDNSHLVLKSNSIKFLEDIQTLLNSVGIIASIEDKTKLLIKNSAQYVKYIGFLSEDLVDDVDNLNDLNEIILKEFVSEEEVFDLTVDNESHTYWTQGCNVSNCFEIGMMPKTESGISGSQGCVSYDTKLITKDGVELIGEVVDNNKEIEIWNGEKWCKVKPFKTGENRELFRVHFNDGSYLDCTDNHKYLVKTRGEIDFYEIELKDLISTIKEKRLQYQIPQSNVKYNNKDKSKEDVFKFDFKELSKSDGLPKEIFSWSRESIIDFFGKWIDVKGEETVKCYEIRDSELIIRDGMLLLTKLGIRSKIVSVINNGVKLWCLQIFDTKDLYSNRIKLESKFNESIEDEYQTILSIEKLEGLHNSYCFEEPETHRGLFGNVLTKQCNLVEINGSKASSREDFLHACKAAAIIGTMQAAYTDFKYVEPTTKEIFDREALLGVSITGFMTNPNVLLDPEIQKEGARIVKKINKEVAEMIGIRQAARTTCVKPSGNSSVLLGTSSGIHGSHSRWYIRNVQSNKEDDITKYLRDVNPKMVEESVWSTNKTDYVISFPIVANPDEIFKDQLYGVKLLEYVKLTQQNWVEEGTNVELCQNPTIRHNVSNTVQVDDWDAVENYIFENRKFFAGVSLLPMTGDKDYNQAPFISILNPEELLEKYGDAVLFASGLVVDGLNAFNNDLWLACNTLLGIGEKLEYSESEVEEKIRFSTPRELWENLGFKNGTLDALSKLMIKPELEEYKRYMDSKLISNVHNIALKRDWIRRAKQFSERYFKSHKEMIYCLKDINNYHKWVEINREIVDIDWSNVNIKPKYVDVDTMGAVACSGGACEII